MEWNQMEKNRETENERNYSIWLSLTIKNCFKYLLANIFVLYLIKNKRDYAIAMACIHKWNDMQCRERKNRTIQHSNKWITHTQSAMESWIVYYMAPTPYYKHSFARPHARPYSHSLSLSFLLYILRLQFYLSCIM